MIDAERLLPRAIGHQPRTQVGHFHTPAVLRYEGLHVELFPPLAEVAGDAEGGDALREQALAHVEKGDDVLGHGEEDSENKEGTQGPSTSPSPLGAPDGTLELP
jgi:hypothetical protein